jgi:hypothetical protein
MKRNTAYSVILLIVLAIAAYFVMNREGESSSTGSSDKMLVTYDSAAVDKMEVTGSSGTVSLEKTGGVWMITGPIRYKADESAVAAAVGKGRKIELRGVVSENAEKQNLFQVDSTGTAVRIYEKGTLKASFHVGKVSNTYTETYVRLEGSNEVQLAADVLTSTFGKQLKEWRDKTIFKREESSLTTVRFQYGDTTFVLAMQDSLWRVDKDSAVQTSIKPLLTSLAHIQADEFIDSTLSTVPKVTAILTVGGTEIRFFRKDDNKYLVLSSESPQWYEIQGWRATGILKRKKDLIPLKK